MKHLNTTYWCLNNIWDM